MEFDPDIDISPADQHAEHHRNGIQHEHFYRDVGGVCHVYEHAAKYNSADPFTLPVLKLLPTLPEPPHHAQGAR